MHLLLAVCWLAYFLFITCSQVDPEPLATELEEKLNLSDEQEQADVEEREKAAVPEHPNPVPPAVVEESHSPAPVEEEAPEEDVDSRQHLNVVFIGHVGMDDVASSALTVFSI